jgi:pimeloyl-ACP methyl ester carboxylesterase
VRRARLGRTVTPVTRRVSVVLLAMLLVGAACGSHDKKSPNAAGRSNPASTTSISKSQQTTGPYAVGTRTFAFVDESRPLSANDTRPDAPRRTIVTNVWYPAEGQPTDADTPDAKPVGGPFPLIVFSHGRSGEPQQYAASFRLWVRAGYVVAAPRHPLTIRGLPFGSVTADIQNQPADLSFVITRMRAELPNEVDIDHVAVVGHSSGAITALGAGFNTCCHDNRIDAVVLESVIAVPFAGGTYSDALPATPVLFFHGDADAMFPIASGRSAFQSARPPKFFVTIQGGGHTPPYRDGPPDFHLVAQSSLDFFDRYLKGRGDALDRLRADVAMFSFGRLEAVTK